jgi:hypothetical protein
MPYTYNPLLKVGLDQTGAGGGASVAGSDTEIQYNDGGSLGASVDLTWDDSGKVLGVGGDIDLDDGGTYTTTLQTITPTAARTISFPDATGTVALVAGSSGQLVYNNAGAQAGAPGSVVGATGDITLGLNGAASTPPLDITGTWFTGGTATTTKPQVLIEPTGTTSTAWSTSGTGFGVNAASGFAGNLLDLQVNGTSSFFISPATTNFAGTGNISLNTIGSSSGSVYARQGTGSGTIRTYILAGFGVGVVGTETSHPLNLRSNNATRLTLEAAGGFTVADAQNFAVGTTTGTKIGTATTQKLGFFDKTPVVQPIAVADATDAATVITQLNALLSRMRDLGLIAT